MAACIRGAMLRRNFAHTPDPPATALESLKLLLRLAVVYAMPVGLPKLQHLRKLAFDALELAYPFPGKGAPWADIGLLTGLQVSLPAGRVQAATAAAIAAAASQLPVWAHPQRCSALHPHRLPPQRFSVRNSNLPDLPPRFSALQHLTSLTLSNCRGPMLACSPSSMVRMRALSMHSVPRHLPGIPKAVHPPACHPPQRLPAADTARAAPAGGAEPVRGQAVRPACSGGGPACHPHPAVDQQRSGRCAPQPLPGPPGAPGPLPQRVRACREP